ncbi:hypothetical protein [Tolypothrix sp. VBCCA 56010]|uniref:hypothetical protein n=1 Tax=Tolypothrix sp. VBCCA 56010 TaxID=3137731 RepID=UPI003D7CAF56
MRRQGKQGRQGRQGKQGRNYPMPNAQCPIPNDVKFIAISQKQSTLVKSNGLLGAKLLSICLGK